MSARPASTRWLFLLLAATVAVVVLYFVWLKWGFSPPATSSQPAPPAAFPLPPYSETRFLNTGPDAKYIGSTACAVCHADRHQSYLLTPHSRALSDLDPKAEPPDGAFVHEASGRSYRTYRQDGQLRQEEVVRTADGIEMARVDLPVRYLVGSGNFSRSYLVEVDGFLHESPITWYSGKQKWAVSPGYDKPGHVGFERPVGADCLACHAGRVEETGGAVHRLSFPEKAIGCENCHGPGSVHQELQRTKKTQPGSDDWTIVNPGKLSRPLLEAICAECHMSGAEKVNLRGRQAGDFRPGRPLTDFRTDYRFEPENEKMTVVGHMEQLRQSKCYQQSKDLSCLTCHDPHLPAKPKDVTAYYRQKCLTCHDTKPCRLDEPQRRLKEPADNCIACHMPRGDTDIPHIAFTHHRIGLHGTKPAAAGPVPQLVPTADLRNLSKVDKERNLGLAYFAASMKAPSPQYAAEFHKRAQELLEEVHSAGLRDGDSTLALASIYWTESELAVARTYAREAVAANDAPPLVRSLALMILAYSFVQERDFASAIAPLEELVRLRRVGDDWRLLGISYLRENQPQKALPALLEAVSIRPYDPAIHNGLAEVYEQRGDAVKAKEHREKAAWFSQHRPR